MARSKAAEKRMAFAEQKAFRYNKKRLARKKNRGQIHGMDDDLPSSLRQAALAARSEWLAHRDSAKIAAMAIGSPPEPSEAACRPWWVVVGTSPTKPFKPSQRMRPRAPMPSMRERKYVLMALAPESASPPSWSAEADNIAAHISKAGAAGWPFIWQKAVGGDARSIWEAGAIHGQDEDDARVGWLAALTGILWTPLSGSRRARAFGRIESIFDRRRESRRIGRPAPETWVAEFGAWAPAMWHAGGALWKIHRDAAKEGQWPAVEAARSAMFAAGATRVELCPNFMEMHPDALASREAFQALVEKRCDFIRAGWDIAHAAKVPERPRPQKRAAL